MTHFCVDCKKQITSPRTGRQRKRCYICQRLNKKENERRRYLANRKLFLLRAKEYRHTHAEKIKIDQAVYATDHREEAKARAKAHYNSNKEVIKLKRRNATKTRHAIRKCAWCGKNIGRPRVIVCSPECDEALKNS